jgi:hypothetical protein
MQSFALYIKHRTLIWKSQAKNEPYPKPVGANLRFDGTGPDNIKQYMRRFLFLSGFLFLFAHGAWYIFPVPREILKELSMKKAIFNLFAVGCAADLFNSIMTGKFRLGLV